MSSPALPGIAGLRAIRTPAYVVLTMAMVLPLLDYANGLLPLNLGDALWRFGAVSLVASYAVATTAQLFLILAVASIFGDRKVLITIAVVSGLLSLTLLGVLGMYGLDALQARARISEGTQRRLDITTGIVVLKLVTLLVANAILARFAGRAAQKARAIAGTRSDPILVPRTSDSIAARR